MSGKNSVKTLPNLFTSQQVALISGTIVQEAFRRVEAIEDNIEQFIEKNIEKIVLATLGFERDSDSTYRVHGTNGYTGPLIEFIRDKARNIAKQRAEPIIKDLGAGKFKDYVSKDLKRSVSEYFDREYEAQMTALIKAELKLDDTYVQEQITEIVSDSRRAFTAASKVMMTSYIDAATSTEKQR